MRRLLLVTALLGMALGGFPTPTLGQTVPPAWWDPDDVRGPADFRKGWNLRVPLHVHNTASHPLLAGEVAVSHLDLGQLTVEAGWPSVSLGDLRAPRGFTLDPESVRLVHYGEGWDRILGPVPVRVHPEWFEPDQQARFGRIQTETFNPVSAALITLVWRLPADVPPARTQFYYVYYDALENSDKATGFYGAAAEERLDGSFWLGRGTVFYGVEPGQTAPNLEVAGIYPDTHVHVYLYPPGLPFPRRDDRPGVVNPFTVQPGQVVRYARELGPGAVLYKVVADRPVLVNTYSAGPSGGAWVPSLGAGLLGTQFRFVARTPGVFLTMPFDDNPTPADVQVRSPMDGATQPVRLFPGETQLVPINGFDAAGTGVDADVRSNRPILVQLAPVPATPEGAPVMGLVQVPSFRGSPVGRHFVASVRSSSESGIQAVAHDAPARLQVFDPDDARGPVHPKTGGVDVVPPGIAQRRFVSSNALAELGQFPGQGLPPRITKPHLIRAADCEEWHCAPGEESLDGRLSLRAGLENQPASAVGGREGLVFDFTGGFVAVAHYNGTIIETARLDGAAAQVDEAALDADMSLTYEAPSGAALRVTSTKPITVFPWPLGTAVAYTIYPPARPTPVPVQVGAGEFRGYLIDLSSPLGEEPLLVTGKPGDRVRVPLEVRNLARWSDGSQLPDAVSFHVEPSAADWPGRASVEPGQMALGPGALATADLVLDLPPDRVGTLSFHVRAASAGNPNAASDLQVLLFVQRSFGVRLWFGEPGSTHGPRELEVRLPPQGERVIGMVLQNTGSGPDTFRVGIVPPAGQWSAQLLRNGVPVDRIENVPPQGRVPFALRLVAPSAADVAAVAVPVDAESESSSSASDRIIALARLSFGLDLRLDVPDPVGAVDPGAAASFVAHVANQGKEPVRVRLRLVPQVPQDWTVRFVGEVDGPLVTEITLFPRQTASFTIEMAARAGAAFRDSGSVLVLAEAGEDPVRLADVATLVASVRQVLNLAVTAAPAPLAAPGESIELSVTATNRGNGPVLVQPATVLLPPGWNLTLPAKTLAAGGTTTLRLPLLVPATALVGNYTVQLRFEGTTGAAGLAEFSVHVKRVHRIVLGSLDEPLVLPGETRTQVLTVENRGNGLETLRIEPLGGDLPGLDTSPRRLALSPGARAAIRVVVPVPADAADGPKQARLRLVSQESADEQSADLRVHVVRPELRIASSQVIGGRGFLGDVVFVVGRIHNEGRGPAHNVSVALVRDGEVVDAVRLGLLPPGHESVVTLRSPLVEDANLTLVIDPERLLPESDRSDNAASLGSGTGPLGAPDRTPGVSPALLVTALVVALGGRRRR